MKRIASKELRQRLKHGLMALIIIQSHLHPVYAADSPSTPDRRSQLFKTLFGNATLSTLGILSKEIKSQYAFLTSGSWDPAPINRTPIAGTVPLTDLMVTYQQKKDAIEYDRGVAKRSVYAYRKAVSATGVDRFFFGALDWGLDRVATNIDARGKKMAGDILLKAIDENKGWTGRKISDLQGKSFSQAATNLKIRETLDSIAKNSQLSPHDKIVFNNAALSSFVDLWESAQRSDERAFAKMAYERKIDRAEVEKAQRDFKALSGAVNQFNKQMTSNVNQLVQQQASIQKNLNSLSNIVDENIAQIKTNSAQIKMNSAQIKMNSAQIQTSKADIKYIQAYLYENMTELEKADALRSSSIHSDKIPNPQDRKKEALRLELEASRKKYLQTALEVANRGQAFIALAQQWGVSPQLLAAPAKIIEVNTAGIKAMQALTSGSPFAYVDAVLHIGGLFGGGGPDAGEQRHQQVMDTLTSIIGNQQLLHNTIIEGFNGVQRGLSQINENMFRLHQQNMEALLRLEERTALQHQTIIGKLEELEAEVLGNREILAEILEEELGNCTSFLNTRITDGRYGFSGGKFANFAGLSNHYSDHSSSLGGCLQKLQLDFPIDTSIRKIFVSRTYDVAGSESRMFRKRVYEPLVQFFKNSLNENRNSKLVSLSLPTERLNDTYWKANDKQLEGPLTAAEVERILPEYLSVGAIEREVSYLLEVHTYYELLSQVPSGPLKTVDELLQSPNGLRKTGLQYLKKALSIVQYAIAQQNLLSGDSFLPTIADFVNRSLRDVPVNYWPGEETDARGPKEGVAWSQIYDLWSNTPSNYAFTLLENNPVLARNVFHYLVLYALNEKKMSLDAYGKLLASKDLVKLNLLLRDPTISSSLPIYNKFRLQCRDTEIPAALTSPQGGIIPGASSSELEKALIGRSSNRIAFLPAGCSAWFIDRFLPLPTVEQMKSQHVLHTDEMEILLNLRSELASHIMSYEYANPAIVATEEQRAYKQILLGDN